MREKYMNKIENIIEDLNKLSKIDKNELFNICLENKLQKSLVLYYEDLQNKFDTVYNNVIGKSELRRLRDINMQLLKSETRWGEWNGKK